jgi:hypothetical protein
VDFVIIAPRIEFGRRARPSLCAPSPMNRVHGVAMRLDLCSFGFQFRRDLGFQSCYAAEQLVWVNSGRRAAGGRTV